MIFETFVQMIKMIYAFVDTSLNFMHIFHAQVLLIIAFLHWNREDNFINRWSLLNNWFDLQVFQECLRLFLGSGTRIIYFSDWKVKLYLIFWTNFFKLL